MSSIIDYVLPLGSMEKNLGAAVRVDTIIDGCVATLNEGDGFR